MSYYLSLDGKKWGLAVARRRRSTRRRSGLERQRRISNVAVPPAPATVNAAAVIQTAVVI